MALIPKVIRVVRKAASKYVGAWSKGLGKAAKYIELEA
jgi:hypothetical protein